MSTVISKTKRELPVRHWSVVPFGSVAVILCTITGFRGLAEVLGMIVVSYLTFLITVEYIDRYYAKNKVHAEVYLALSRAAVNGLLNGTDFSCKQEYDVSPMKIELTMNFTYASDEDLEGVMVASSPESVKEESDDYAFSN